MAEVRIRVSDRSSSSVHESPISRNGNNVSTVMIGGGTDENGHEAGDESGAGVAAGEVLLAPPGIQTNDTFFFFYSQYTQCLLEGKDNHNGYFGNPTPFNTKLY